MPKRKRPPRRTAKLPDREINRRRAGLGLGRHDDPELIAEGLAIVARFLAHLRQRASDVSGQRTGYSFPLAGGAEWVVRCEAVHVRTRGAFCPDFLNALTLTDYEHRHMPGCQQNNPEFFEERRIHLDELLWRVTVDYLSDHLDDCRWLAANVGDGTLSKLAADVLEGNARLAVAADHGSGATDMEPGTAGDS